MRRVVAVTGANRGIGFEIVCLLLEAGHSVVACVRDPSSASSKGAVKRWSKMTATQEGGDKGSLLVCELEICDEKQIELLRSLLENKFGFLDTLINNAGMAYKVATSRSFSVLHKS